MHTVLVVVLAILAGSFAAFITSIAANRSAKADRTFDARKTACLALEKSRQEQLSRVSNLQNQLINPPQTVTLSQPEQDEDLNALVAISLSESLRKLVKKTNEQQNEYLDKLNACRIPIQADAHNECVVGASEEFEKFLKISEKLQESIRNEIGIAK
jgi:hypothetical protein